MKKRSNILFLLLAVVLSLPAIFGILHNGFFPSDDGNWMVIRFSAFYEELSNGQFPVRFLGRLNYGYGYPVSDFLYPLFMYIGVPIHAIGFGFVSTIKIIFAGSMILSSIFSFLWLRRLFDNMSSLVGSLVYLYAPYHLFNLYSRGSIGEVLALAIVPFILWQIERNSLIWSTIGIFLLILSHNTLAVLFLSIIFLYMFLNILIAVENRRKLVYQYTSILVLSLGMSAFFWIPAIYDLQYTVFSKTQVSDWDNYFSDVSLIGLPALFIIILTLVLTFIGRIKIRKHRLTFLLFILGAVSLFFATSVSFSLWNVLPVSFIQFPFRFLSLTILCVSFLAACSASVVKNTTRLAVVIAILFLTLISAWPFLFPKSYQYNPESFYSTNQDSTTVKNEYMPKWVKDLPTKQADAKAEVINGEEKLNILNVSPNKISLQGYFPIRRVIQINTVYFPGWEVAVDGKPAPIDYSSNGLIRFDVPAGSHSIIAKFGETNVRIIADIISAAGLLLVIVLLTGRKYKRV